MQSDPVMSVRGFPLTDYGFRSPLASATTRFREPKKAAVGRFSSRAPEQTAQRLVGPAATASSSSAKRGQQQVADHIIDENAAGGSSGVPIALERRRKLEVSPVLHRVRHRQQQPASTTPARTIAADAAAAAAVVPRRGKSVSGSSGVRGGRRGSLRRARAVANATGKPITIRRVAAVPSRKATTASAASKAKAKAAGRGAVRAHGAPTNNEAGNDEGGEEVPGRSALSVADAVVTEYEKLLAAIPTLARHMGKLQLDTEAMAEGLEKRVRSLVDGYHELNDLVEQAPARVSDAASEYVQALGLRPQEPPVGVDAAGTEDKSNQALDVEGIHRELFALREAKLALDQVVMPASVGLRRQTTELEATRSARRRGLSKLAASTVEDGTKRYQRSSTPAGATVARSTSRGGRAGDVAAALSAAAAKRARVGGGGGGGGGTRRSSGRRALAEMQVDPDLPLPLPTFPGRGKFLRGDADQPHSGRGKERMPNQQRRPAGDPKPASFGGSGGGPSETDGQRHGYYVPGVVLPRQRQSHGFPPELRAISTIPTPEKRLPPTAGSARATGTGQRRRVRSRSTAVVADRGAKTQAPPSRPPASAPAATAASETRGGGMPSPRPEPGSAAALASAREQRRVTIQAVDELRKEMREREGRLERKLDRLKQTRSERAALADTTAAGDSDQAPKAAPAPTAVGGKRRAVSASRGRPRMGRPLSRPLASKEKKPASTKLFGDEKRARGDDDNSEQAVAARPVETADAQAQTAADGVQLFLQPQPAVREAFRAAEDQRRQLPQRLPMKVSTTLAQQTGTNMDDGRSDHGRYCSEGSFTSSSSTSSTADEDDNLGRRIAGRRLSPPPPVVFIEGEGRNVSWRPADDDRLLRPDGGSSGRVARLRDGGPARSGGVGGGSDEAVREGVDGGQPKRIFTADSEGGGKENETAGEEEKARPEPRAIRVTAGRLEVTGSEPETLAAGVQDDVWVELAGMLALSAAESPAGQPNELASTETPATGGGAVTSLAEKREVSPELLALMREVVGQQKEMGEERSALLQALRAEVDSRRVLLANQELSLRERELALGRRESDSGVASATARLAAATASAEAERRKQQQQEEADKERRAAEEVETRQLTAPPPPAERFWPTTSDDGVETAESSDGIVAIQHGAPDEGTAPREEAGSGGQLPTHSFRSTLGRLLAAGSGWRDLPLDEVRAPGKEFATSLGRVLAGGPAWHQLHLVGEEQAHGNGVPGVVSGGGGRTLGPGRRSTAHAGGEFNVQELLREAGRAEASSESSQISSPETAVRKRASALESRRFLAAMAEAEAKKHAEDDDDDDDDDGDSESKVDILATEREQRPPPPPGPPSISSALQQQQQQGNGRLHLSLATAVLSVAQRLSTVEERASARAEGAEGLARQALEETRREGAEGRERQSQVLHRLKNMEHRSEKRAKLVAREIADLREEGRLERQRRSQLLQAQSRRAAIPTPRSLSSRGSSSGGNGSFLEALSLEAAAPVTPPLAEEYQQQQPTPARSDSRSLLSEGQLRGSFSDGELLRLTPRGTHALEDGELPPPPPPARQGARSEAETVVGGSAGRNWSRGGDPRQHLTLLMSAHPHLKANRAPARGGRLKNSADAVGGAAGAGDGRRRVAPPRKPLPGMGADDGLSRGALLGGAEGTGEERLSGFELGVSEAGDVSCGDDSGSTLSGSGCSLEPGQARPPVRHSWQERVSLASAGGVGVSSSRGNRGGGEQLGLGPSWLRHRDAAASEDTAYSAGEASSGAELGEAPSGFMDQDLDDLAAGEEGREEGPASRPLKALAVGTASSATRRRRQTEIQRAVAEAELDLCDATAATLDSGLAESPAEAVTKAKRVIMLGEEKICGQTSDSSAAADDFGKATEMVSPDECRGDRRGTALEPGEVPV